MQGRVKQKLLPSIHYKHTNEPSYLYQIITPFFRRNVIKEAMGFINISDTALAIYTTYAS